MRLETAELAKLLSERPDLAAINPDVSQPVTCVTVPGATEHDEQAAVIAWARANEDVYPELRLLYAVPNGEYRHPATAGRLKAQGVRPGTPDLALPVARRGKHALYIEMKRKGGKASPAQISTIDLLRYYGNSAVVCVGAQDAIETIKFYLEIDE
jgi:hypothetical protein